MKGVIDKGVAGLRTTVMNPARTAAAGAAKIGLRPAPVASSSARPSAELEDFAETIDEDTLKHEGFTFDSFEVRDPFFPLGPMTLLGVRDEEVTRIK